ncbi:MAG: hypothetical protein HXX08_02665 [Chloroflexi bacterium]|uniref:Uncharacterized protein n=1 Tax=Candidatus Chlorohelix allophototropha TaxID=3003348 RepID=A0A8T7LRY9_9CHLR|nr:hypothetical protein [Chloroflexota bacterium]WJW66642.1 hypothetical protein OZ401_002453 [Chloroflexota bacterium L227-S17]
MGWEKIPWEEPSEITGSIETSAMASRFYALKRVSLAIIRGEKFPLNYPEFDSFLATEEEYNLFPQYYGCYTGTVFFIPASFDKPFYLKDESYGTYSVGSSYVFQQEIGRVTRKVEEQTKIYGLKSLLALNFPTNNPEYTWDDILDLATTLKIGSEESIKLNLPLKLLW